MNKILTFFSLFGSMSTLLCCALPVTLVSIGMGASFASLTSSFPQIIWLTERKDALFIITGVILLISFILMKRASRLPCPIDQKQRELCERSRKLTRIFFWISVSAYFIGLIFSFIIPRILYGS